MSTLGVVIVTHNSEAVIGACLDSLAALDAGVVVVDNASADGTRREVLRHAGVTLIANPWNRGFAAAVNQGFDALDSACVLLLNPDASVVGGIEEMLAACHQGAGIVAGKLVDAAGRPQAGFMVRRFPTAAALSFEALGLNRLWPRNPVNRKYRAADLDPERAARVEQPAGAFLLIRRDIWRELGGFDESFIPLWFEDVDFCRRAALAGHPIEYRPGATARHLGGHSAGQLSMEHRAIHWYGNLLRYAAKHFGRPARVVVCSAVMLGAVFRTLWGIPRSRSLKLIGIYARVIRLAVTVLVSGRERGQGLSLAAEGR